MPVLLILPNIVYYECTVRRYILLQRSWKVGKGRIRVTENYKNVGLFFFFQERSLRSASGVERVSMPRRP